MLKGILKCDHCGCALTTSYTQKKGVRYYFYRCHQHHKHKIEDCPNKNIPAESLENQVIKNLKQISEQTSNSISEVEMRFVQLLRRIFNIWDYLLYPAKREFLLQILDHITIDRAKQSIQFEINETGVELISQSMTKVES